MSGSLDNIAGGRYREYSLRGSSPSRRRGCLSLAHYLRGRSRGLPHIPLGAQGPQIGAGVIPQIPEPAKTSELTIAWPFPFSRGDGGIVPRTVFPRAGVLQAY